MKIDISRIIRAFSLSVVYSSSLECMVSVNVDDDSYIEGLVGERHIRFDNYGCMQGCNECDLLPVIGMTWTEFLVSKHVELEKTKNLIYKRINFVTNTLYNIMNAKASAFVGQYVKFMDKDGCVIYGKVSGVNYSHRDITSCYIRGNLFMFMNDGETITKIGNSDCVEISCVEYADADEIDRMNQEIGNAIVEGKLNVI